MGYFGRVADHSDKESGQPSIIPRPESTKATIAPFDDSGRHFEVVMMIALSEKLGQHFEVMMIALSEKLDQHFEVSMVGHPYPQQHPLLEIPGSNLV